MTSEGAMDTSEILATLDEQYEKRSTLDEGEALESPVDYDQFVKFIGSVETVEVVADEYVRVQFREPVPATLLDGLTDGYRYNMAVARDSVDLGSAYVRFGMPKSSLLTLQQVAIVVWAMATGEIY